MRRVILQIDLSIDGFAAGPHGETDWVTSDEEMNHDGLDLLKMSDTILLGRVAYQDFSAYWPFADPNPATTLGQITQQLNQATKIVFSTTLNQVAWGRWNNAKLIKGNIAEEVDALKALPGKDMLLYAGAEIVSKFIQLNLVDEYLLRVHPVILGTGKPIFSSITGRVHLSPVKTKSYLNGATMLIYQPRNALALINS